MTVMAMRDDAMKMPVVAVLDIGKTNVKLGAIRSGSHGGEVLAERRMTNQVMQGVPYPHVDEAGIWAWLKRSLAELAIDYYVESIAITTHGATAACLAGDKLALPILDYESTVCQSVAREYQACRPPFAETGSPHMAVGLNLGTQLFWLSQAYANTFSGVTDILTYPQYWGWRLSGVKVSEATSLGCHTDLWNPHSGDFSTLVDTMNWRSLFPDVAATGETIGSIRPELAQELGLPEDCQIGNGIHDSNASLVPHLLTRSAPFTVVSSGTWTVICGVGADLDGLQEHDDMLVNVNAYGEPVPTIRFMGGREWELLRGAETNTLSDLASVMSKNVLAMPSFVDQGGPFRHHSGTLLGPANTLNETEKTALASAYCALMTHYCLGLLNNTGDVIVEGAFARNEVYLQVLGTLLANPAGDRIAQKLWFSTDSTGTTQGTSMLGQNINHWPIPDARAVPLQPDYQPVLAYAERWRAEVMMIPSVSCKPCG